MDFSTWSPSHTIIAIFAAAGFIGQIAALFYRTGQLEKRIEKQGEDIRQQGETFFHALERLEDRVDKRFTEIIPQMTQQISEVRTEIGNLQSEMKQNIGSVREEISKLNQNHIDHLIRHQDEKSVSIGLTGPPTEE